VNKTVPPTAIVLAITGASGAPIALTLLKELLQFQLTIHLVFSETGKKIFRMETRAPAEAKKIIESAKKEFAKQKKHILAKVIQYEENNFFAPPASGTNLWEAMVICPASAGICGRIASGTGEDLIARCADVALKEKRKLILLVRESPLSQLLLENLLRLSRAGAVILPPMLTFYHQPESQEEQINFWVAKVLDILGFPHKLIKRWGTVESK